MIRKILYIFLFATVQNLWAQAIAIDTHNKAQLQRGAKLFMNYCSGCHSLKYLPYKRMAEDLGLVNEQGKVNKQLLDLLNFTQASMYEPIQPALRPADAKGWFGTVPPDLSLITKERGVTWVYNYLKGFYPDNSRPFGVNNLLSPNVAMPNILESLFLTEDAMQTEEALTDLLSFLVYVSDPTQVSRTSLGVFVIIFLAIMLIIVYGLKIIYWRHCLLAGSVNKIDEE